MRASICAACLVLALYVWGNVHWAFSLPILAVGGVAGYHSRVTMDDLAGIIGLLGLLGILVGMFADIGPIRSYFD